MRGFKRWMKFHGIEYSDALLISTGNSGDDDSSRSLSISVTALCDLKEDDVVSTIPKQSCLTVKTSAAGHLIEEAQLGGYLGLAVAIMYEKSIGPQSKWFEYLQILPPFEPIPLLWSLPQIDALLSGTELHKIVREDKALVHQDWKECIKPLLDTASFDLNPDFFTVDEYLAAKSLIASRSFQIDEYHGFGMVPLADLFNHKTAAEDVHFTSVSSSSESDIDTESGAENADDENDEDHEPIAPVFNSETGDFSGSDLEFSPVSGNEPTYLEMIIIKDVKAGTEVFNTYGPLGNAALLHRYGFTETDNPFDILNIDLDIVVQWSLSLFSCRHSRGRLSLWRKLEYSGCVSQDSEYFEISIDGEPQVELLVLLYIMLLPEDDFFQLELALSVTGQVKETPSSRLLKKVSFLSTNDSELNKKLLVTQSVCRALSSLADARESFYGPNSLEDDVKSFNECCCETDPKLYHSLILRVSERRIIEKLKHFAASGAGNLRAASGARKRKRVDRK
ncbi:n-lysine methyltransferase setd6 [Phtheirospermum japonicum]|uniref:N-lysine methyltransferase n=1 Tax=Phtheirospermum japonicum TaxID=374723 RepID=A0A830BY45_9LAMI|nr:n-lysine methyltransferase setd6 [Phtheirospermum japonicum]